MSEENRFKVNLRGMIDILSNHLYSSPDVFIRELLQNGTDAISARKLFDKKFSNGTITIEPKIIAGKKTIIFSDNGIGLSYDEINQFLAVIGQSSKRDIITERISEEFIGRFGIGLLSCFMVTNEIRLTTHSAKTGEYLEWIGTPDGIYKINRLESCPDGTSFYIALNKNSEEYFEADRIIELVRYYGLPLPFPIMLKTEEGSQRINTVVDYNSDMHDSIMSFGKDLFGIEFMDYIPLNSPTGLFSGVAYILPYRIAATAKNSHRIYLKHMLLTENGSTLLPEWAFFVRCFINTNSLRPTASREDFYEDDALEVAKEEIGECIEGYLMSLSKTKPDILRKMVSIHNLAIKSMAIDNNELFNIFIDYLEFETTSGIMTGSQIRDFDEPFTVAFQIDKFKQYSPIFSAQNNLLVNAGYVYDDKLICNLIDEYELDATALDEEMFLQTLEDIPQSEYSEYRNFLDIANETLIDFDCQAEIKAFQPYELSALYIMDEQAELFRQILHAKENSDSLFADIYDAFAEEIENHHTTTLVFNSENTLIQNLKNISKAQLTNIIKILYVQSLLLGHYPLRNNEITIMDKSIEGLINGGILK